MAVRASAGKKVHFCNSVMFIYYSDTSVAEILTLKQAVLIVGRSERAGGRTASYFLSASFAYWHQSCDIHQINRAVSVSPLRLQLP